MFRKCARGCHEKRDERSTGHRPSRPDDRRHPAALRLHSAADAKTSGRTEATTPFADEITGKLDAALAGAMTQAGASGAIVGVWAPWAGTWTTATGTTTTTGNDKLTTDMRFRIGTNTTAMTCTVLLKLVDEKRVELSDPVSEVPAPGFPGSTTSLSGQLCQNTSGLPTTRAQLGPPIREQSHP